MKDMELYVIESAKERETSEHRRYRQRLEYRKQKETQRRDNKTQTIMATACLVLILVSVFAIITANNQRVKAVEQKQIKTTVEMLEKREQLGGEECGGS